MPELGWSLTPSATDIGGSHRAIVSTLINSGRSGLDVLQLIEQFQQLLKRLRAELLLNLQVVAFHPRTHVDETLLPLLGQGDEYRR